MDIGFLLFSSMLNPTELYLSKEFKNKPKAARSKINKPKVTISKTIDNKISLFRKKAAAAEDSIDHEIEMAMADIRKPEQENIIEELLAKELIKNSAPEVAKYETPINKTSNEIKSALKSLYQTFVSYAKGAYTKIKSEGKNIAYGSRKIIEGPVRMTLAKFIKVFEYVLAALNPQWNMPTLSKMDFDTLSPAVTNHIVIDEDSIKYDSSYGTLRYWSK